MLRLTFEDYAQAAQSAKSFFEDKGVLPGAAVKDAWLSLLDDFTRRASEDGVNLDYFHEVINEAGKVLMEFCELTAPVFAGEANRPLWRHQKINRFGDLDPRTDANLRKLRELVSRYASTPMIHSDFLDWVFADSLMFTEIKAFTRAMMMTQFGTAPGNPAYFLAKGDEAKYRILKPAFAVLGVIANYVTPAAVGYYFIESGHEFFGLVLVTLALGGLVAFAVFHPRRQKRRERNELLLDKTIELYGALAEGYIPRAHVRQLIDAAAALGMRVDRNMVSIVARDA